MKAYLHNRGYSLHTKTGWVESRILNLFQNSIKNNNTLILNACKFGNKHTRDKDYEELLKLNIDKVYLTVMADPYSGSSKRYIDNFLKEKNIEPVVVGYSNNQFNFDFWSICCGLFFKPYSLDELKPTFKKIFLSYNRKPKEHRLLLIEKLIENNLIDCGIVTTSQEIKGYKYTLEEYNNGMFDQKIDGKPLRLQEFNGIPEDIYTLGIVPIWQDCFLTIVSETVSEEYNYFFISEKIFKPIIGMRPFVINGQKKIYEWLEANNFKTFEKYWPHINLRKGNTQENIINVIEYLKTKKLPDLYNEMYADICHNKETFKHYFSKELLKPFIISKNL